jgi:acyl-CoA reductase-like NAD-dependent aldehyde dehydrogenase
MLPLEPLMCRDPHSGELLGSLPQLDRDAVRNAVVAARAAQPKWRTASWGDRAAVLGTVLEAVVSTRDELVRILAHETGKTMAWGALEELVPAMERLEFLASFPPPGDRVLVPHGVVALSMGDRTPLFDTLAIGATGLAAGNAVLLHPDARAAWCTTAFARVIQDALRARGHASALLQVITGNEETDRQLRAADIDAIGSTLPERARPRARSWVVVASTTPPDRAHLRALLAPLGAPRACGFFIGPDRLSQWSDALAEALPALSQDPPASETSDVGVASGVATERCEAAIEGAVARGARHRVLGPRGAGLLQLADPRDPMLTQRIEAPLVILAPYNDRATLGRAVRGLPRPVAAVVLLDSQQDASTLGQALGVDDLYLGSWGAWAQPTAGPPTPSDHDMELRQMGVCQAVISSQPRDDLLAGPSLAKLQARIAARFAGGAVPRVSAAASLLRSWWSGRKRPRSESTGS